MASGVPWANRRTASILCDGDMRSKDGKSFHHGVTENTEKAKTEKDFTDRTDHPCIFLEWQTPGVIFYPSDRRNPCSSFGLSPCSPCLRGKCCFSVTSEQLDQKAAGSDAADPLRLFTRCACTS